MATTFVNSKGFGIRLVASLYGVRVEGKTPRLPWTLLKSYPDVENDEEGALGIAYDWSRAYPAASKNIPLLFTSALHAREHKCIWRRGGRDLILCPSLMAVLCLKTGVPEVSAEYCPVLQVWSSRYGISEATEAPTINILMSRWVGSVLACTNETAHAPTARSLGSPDLLPTLTMFSDGYVEIEALTKFMQPQTLISDCRDENDDTSEEE